MDQKDEQEKQLVTLLNSRMLQKINLARTKGEVTPKRAEELETWWHEFVQTFELPLVQRTERMGKVIRKGVSQFPDLALFRDMFTTISGKEICPSCSGRGGRKCQICNGEGNTFVDWPYGMGIRGTYKRYVTCNACFGRGHDPCTLCGGKGIIG